SRGSVRPVLAVNDTKCELIFSLEALRRGCSSQVLWITGRNPRLSGGCVLRLLNLSRVAARHRTTVWSNILPLSEAEAPISDDGYGHSNRTRDTSHGPTLSLPRKARRPYQPISSSSAEFRSSSLG